MIAITAAADTYLDALEPGILVVHPADSGPTCLHLPPATVTALVALTDGPVRVDELPTDEPSMAAVLRLARDGVLHFSVVVDRREALRATLTGALSRFDASVGPGDPAVRLSRFALLRRHGDEFVLEFATRQAGGTLTVRPEPGPEVAVEAAGAGGAPLLVLPGGVRIRNTAASTASYRVALPPAVRRVRVRVGGGAEVVVGRAGLGPGGRTVELAGQRGNRE